MEESIFKLKDGSKIILCIDDDDRLSVTSERAISIAPQRHNSVILTFGKAVEKKKVVMPFLGYWECIAVDKGEEVYDHDPIKVLGELEVKERVATAYKVYAEGVTVLRDLLCFKEGDEFSEIRYEQYYKNNTALLMCYKGGDLVIDVLFMDVVPAKYFSNNFNIGICLLDEDRIIEGFKLS